MAGGVEAGKGTRFTRRIMERLGFEKQRVKGREGVPLLASLRWKVAISFSLLLLLVVGLTFLAFIRFEWVFLGQEAQKRAQSLARYLAVNARDPLLALDDLRLGPITESINQDEDVRYAFLMDHQGKVVYHSQTERTGVVLSRGVPDPPGGVIQASLPIMVEGVRVGTAVVGVGTDHIRRAVVTTALGLIIPLAVGAGLGILGIFLLAGHHVKRVERLEEAVQALGYGDLRVHVHDKSRDEVGRLTRHFNLMVAQLHSARRQIERNFKETISALATAFEAKDKYTRGHCERVAGISVALGSKLEMDEARLNELEMAAILHDVGKIGVEGGVVGKVGPLSEGEVDDMKGHPEIGSRILHQLTSLQKVSLFVRHHHEHYDGTGYPRGLMESEIPLASRIIHLVDAFDAMTTDRPYREALSREEALMRVREGSGKQFDPMLVDLFFLLEEEGVIEAICEEVEESKG
ncbi:MAG: HD domain-containing protein [bacterium]|nr:MAG: HD domain-containing protein [bacterium]